MADGPSQTQARNECGRHLLAQLKAPGCSSTQWTLLNSYDNVNDPTSLFGYGVQLKDLLSLRKCDKVFFYQGWILTIDQ